jgi:hypothetical protein
MDVNNHAGRDVSNANHSAFSAAGNAVVGMGAAGVAWPNLATLPEAFERNPTGGGVVAGLFVVWLIYRIIIAWINRPPRN